MRRLVWVALGAAGGIVAYRRGQQMLADARERGVVLSAQQAGLSAMQAVAGARTLATGALAAADSRTRQPASGTFRGSAAASVLNDDVKEK